MKEAALLELALIQYAMQKAVAKVLVDHYTTERLSTDGFNIIKACHAV